MSRRSSVSSIATIITHLRTVFQLQVAGTRSTADNGATRVIPGSHLWGPDRAPTQDQAVSAVMEPGSALFWLGLWLFVWAAPRRSDVGQKADLIGTRLSIPRCRRKFLHTRRQGRCAYLVWCVCVCVASSATTAKSLTESFTSAARTFFGPR